MKFGLLDGREDGEHDDVTLVDVSEMFCEVGHDFHCNGTI